MVSFAPTDQLRECAHEISRGIGYLDVIVYGDAPELPYSCENILTLQESGEDPTQQWRQNVSARQAEFYSCAPREHVGVAFVMGWYLSVIAQPLAWASVISPFVLNGAPEALRFDLLERDHFPCTVSITTQGVSTIANPALRQKRAQNAYETHAKRFVESINTPTKMSSKQRYGLMRDHWSMALDAARHHTGQTTTPSLRESCCFIVALPGARACATCPQRANEWKT